MLVVQCSTLMRSRWRSLDGEAAGDQSVVREDGRVNDEQSRNTRRASDDKVKGVSARVCRPSHVLH